MLAELGQKLSAVRYFPNSYLPGPDWLCQSLGEYIVFVIVAELFCRQEKCNFIYEVGGIGEWILLALQKVKYFG